jgi:hypothetical protein
MTSKAALLLTAILVGCASTPEQEPDPPVGIEISSQSEGRYFGGRAVYVIDAPIDEVTTLLLDFPSQAEFRPTVKEAEIVSTSEAGGVVRFEFRAGGFDPEATCRFTVDRDEETGAVAIRYEMTDPGITLWGLKGGFDLKPLSGGRRTLVEQSFLVSAIMMNRERFLRELRLDAQAIRERAEGGEPAGKEG